MSGGKQYPWVDDEFLSLATQCYDDLSKPMQDYIAVLGMEECFDAAIDECERMEDEEWEDEMERDRR